MQTESEFNKALKETLGLFEHYKTIEWWERLNSGKVETVHGGWMQLSREGTPDWIVVFYDKNKHLFVLWIEGKSDSGIKKKIESAQLEFMEHFNKLAGFKVMRTASVEEVKTFINDNSYDKMTAWSSEVDLFMGSKVMTEEELEDIS